MKTMLLIDDDEELCEGLFEIFQDEGYQVTLAHNSQKALTELEAKSFDVVLLDIRLPGINGIEFLKKIKDSLSKTSVFIMSGAPDAQKLIKRHKLSSTVRGVIKKPFDIASTLSLIRSSL